MTYKMRVAGCVVSLSLCLTAACGSGEESTPAPTARVYTTNFSLDENPIAESGNWVNGQVVGLDWQNVRTMTGLAFGTQTGSNNLDDSIALLTGAWQPDQTVEATVYTVNQSASITEEVELRLRSSLSQNKCTGYEVLFNVRGGVQIFRWNGPLGDYVLLPGGGAASPILKTGDVVKATIVGDTITAYLNGTQVLQASDPTPFQSGSPGMGFFLRGTSGVNADYGFTRFTASE